MSNEDVRFQWSMFCGSAENDDEKALLEMIVNLYVTIRGFSFASSCIERFKKENEKLLQKGKGIRKEVFTSNASSASETS